MLISKAIKEKSTLIKKVVEVLEVKFEVLPVILKMINVYYVVWGSLNEKFELKIIFYKL